ncbi:MAG TPA: ATPase, T2SS/T4P/T4SS family [Baekduia sp.]|uniref:GspE/PulE family protein n=1 Tax=Baekduia sp. TaxID=2600305 RepID=UPI002D781441|nr:ATPase, T2SS/T4P/T4SS family [Baekduia sp.]HET6507705.1 ATPase, T2SS/T4P/T4SS family [Baekduia sp.]
MSVPPPASRPASTTSPAIPDHHPPVSDVPGLIAPLSRGRSTRLIGQVVVELGFAKEADVERAVMHARESGRLTGRVLIEDGVLTPQQLARVLAERFGIERVDLAIFKIDTDLARLVDPSFVRRYDAIPVGQDGDGQLLLAMADPANMLAIDDVTMITGMAVRPVVAAYDDIHRLSVKLGNDLPDLSDEGGDAGDGEMDLTAPANEVTDLGADDQAPIIKLVNSVLKRAIRRGASDIHFDPSSEDMHVVYRVDGMLDQAVQIPRRMSVGVVSRLKVMASLDIAERRTPQDGRVSLLIDGHEIDLRIVTLPTVYGEAVVARILDSSSAPVGLEQIGMLEDDRLDVEEAMARPYGGVLVTGPTGSGKSTTLYSCLDHVNNGTRTIVTVEDPVEYRMDGVKQMAINAKAKMTFAGGLKAIMRADPDIIMVGEIRDGETAHIAVEAALTGHLVLSTLHTRDAPNAVSRLLDMGVEPFLLSSAIDCVVAQRLARKLCDDCKKPVTVAASVMRDHGFDVEGDVEIFNPGGCDRCNQTGYRGRVGIFEVLVLDEELRSLILRRSSADEIAAVAVRKGMKRLREDGQRKVLLGLTSPEEVLRVTAAG